MEKGLHPSIDSLRAHAASEGQFAPVVLTFSEPAGLDVCDAYLAVRRGENSFCFVHDDVVVIGTEPVAVVATRGVDQPASASPFLSNAKQVDPLVEMSAHLSAFSIAEPFRHAQSELNGVLFGFVGFDAIRSFEPSIQSVPAPDVLQIPESVLFQFASLIVIKDGTVYVSALCPLQTLEESYDVCVARVRELQSRLLSATGSVVRTVRDFDGPPSNGEGKSNFGREGYHSHVSFLKQRIVAGDMVQTVPSHRLEVATPAHPVNVWRAMRANRSRYSYVVELANGLAVVGASPELLVSVTPQTNQTLRCETHPIAGTRRRGATPVDDEKLRRELLADEKERAEHVMLVDLGRNDLNRVCEGVNVPRLMQVDFFSHVMHIVSSVQGVLRPGLSPLDAFRSVFPAGTVSGAPKIMACKHIYTREKQRRGLYAGALGWVGFGGEALDFCIAIRTLLFLGPKRCFAQAGGGIVLDSNEEDEYQETLAKMAGVMAAVKGAEKRLCQDSGEEHAEAESDAARRHRAVCVQGGKKESLEKKEASSKGSKELVKNAVLLVDNYDSFTYNLYQLLSREHVVNVVRNDQVTVEQLMASQPSHIVLGPGPCSPSEAGICADVIRVFEGKVPILGVCLGMEVMVEVYGGKIDVCGEIKHGKTSPLLHDGKGVNCGITQGVNVVRYHSLACFRDDLAKNAPKLIVTSTAEDSGVIMGVRHESAAIEGVQFHPESIKTDQGAQMISNFLSWKSGTWEQMGGVPKSILQRIIATLPERPTHEIPMFWKHSVMDMSVVLQQSGMSVVAEVKRASPSKGAIATGTVDAGELASLYASCAGVAAVSVLTEPFFFKGSLDDLQRAREFVEAEAKQSGRKRVALLRKDFVICEAQIVEAREHGADSVLLIAATLSLRKLQTLLHFSRQCELEPLVEVANELELDRAISVGAKLIGVNARDLHSFQVDVERAARLIELGKARSPSTTWVGLSGVSENAHTQRYLRAGATAVVVGEHLMKATSVPSAIAEILGRSAPVKVKVCGLTRDEDVELACKEGADYLGLIFAPASKRVVSVARAVEMAAVARRHSPHPPKIVGVFSKNSDEEIVRFHEAVKFDVIQLCDATSEVRPKDVEVWRVVHISPDAGATTMALNKAREDRLLFDTASAAGGGSGVKFEWSKVLAGREDFVLAGGLTPANVADAARTGAWCVDVCSGCEESPGVKNAALVRRFVRNAKCGECRGLVEILKTLASNAGASADEIANILQMATRGTLTDAQVGGFLTVLAARKDVEQSPAVLRQARSVLLAAARPFAGHGDCLDIVGTGGDGVDTFNVSTAAALVCAAMGVRVAKHGNRSSSGQSGAADFMEALHFSLKAEDNEALLARRGFGFLFAPEHHPAMLRVRHVRKEIGIRTIFNLLGPLVSPAKPSRILVGTASVALARSLASALRDQVDAALVVHSESTGLDELVPAGSMFAVLVKRGLPSQELHLSCEDFGVSPLASVDALLGGTPQQNAARFRLLLTNCDNDAPLLSFVAMNAGAALWLADRAPSLRAGTDMAASAIRDGTVNAWLKSALE